MGTEEVEIGSVEDYFAHVGVAALKITKDLLQIGDVLHIKGHTTDTLQEVSSIQREHESIREAHAGDAVGIKVNEKVRTHDIVYKVISGEHAY